MDLSNPKSLTVLWASLMSDNEVLMTSFLSSRGWDYRTFGTILKKFHTTACFHVAVGKGKHRTEHYDTVVQLILDTAKSFWLDPTTQLREEVKGAVATHKAAGCYPFTCAIGTDEELKFREESKTKQETEKELVVLKKRLGGFYLVYTLFFKQPSTRSRCIRLTVMDEEPIEKLDKQLKIDAGGEVYKEYSFMMSRLKINTAFKFHLLQDDYNIDYATRFYLNTKYDPHVDLLKVCKQIQDELSHNHYLRASEKKLVNYIQEKKNLAEYAEEVFQLPSDETVGSTGLLSFLRVTTPQITELLTEVVTSIKQLGDVPVFSRSSLLGNESAERALISEAGKRKIRVETKEKKTAPAQRYERDIFGSKKVQEKMDEGAGRRGRSQAATNFWQHFIPENFDFNTVVQEKVVTKQGK